MEFDLKWVQITLLTFVIGFFRKEITTFISDYNIYRNRMFDDDGDPGTGQYCYIQTKKSNDFKLIYIKDYKFGFLPSSRVVVTHQDDPEGNKDKIIVVTYTYAIWSEIIKGSLQKDRIKVKKGE